MAFYVSPEVELLFWFQEQLRLEREQWERMSRWQRFLSRVRDLLGI